MDELLTAFRDFWSRVSSYNPLVVAVQLLLIGVVVWWVMRFLRGTRGARLVKGVAVLLAALYVVIRLLPRELGWERIEFLYEKFLLFALVAVVVALQPELRRALIQIGQMRLFRSESGRIEEMIDALVESASYLARNKMGALIAVERTVGLGALVEAGTPLDAVLSSALLNSIFYPGSALHDMGVIVRQGRIASAGCQFPLAGEHPSPLLPDPFLLAVGRGDSIDEFERSASRERFLDLLAHDGAVLGVDQFLVGYLRVVYQFGRGIAGEFLAALAHELHGPELVVAAAVGHPGEIAHQCGERPLAFLERLLGALALGHILDAKDHLPPGLPAQRDRRDQERCLAFPVGPLEQQVDLGPAGRLGRGKGGGKGGA